MNKSINKIIKQVWIILLTCFLIFHFCFFNVQSNISRQQDSDGDGLPDSEEIHYHTDPNDMDSDDDGVLDGDEIDWNKNTDGTGDINALDPDSDDDGVYDGTEMGITYDDLTNDTNLNSHNFHPDADPLINTSMIHWDSDNDCKSDGMEDKNKNGKYEKYMNETDPLFADTDEDGIQNEDDEDRDGDGMYDIFEELFELDICDPGDGEKDYDADGFTNLREYLGHDNKPGNLDWSDPNDSTDIPDLAPVVLFLHNELREEVNQTIIFDENNLKVTDSEEDYQAGLKYTWDFGDGNTESEIVYDPANYSRNYTYRIPGEYLVQLTVEDQNNNIGEDSIKSVFISITDIWQPEPIIVPKPSNSIDYWGLIFMVNTLGVILLIIILVIYFGIKRKKIY